MTVKNLTNQINIMVEQLDEREQMLIFEIVKRFLSSDFADDAATPEDLADIAAAREEYRRGETINHNDIDRNE